MRQLGHLPIARAVVLRVRAVVLRIKTVVLRIKTADKSKNMSLVETYISIGYLF
jgi:hypothetical protein